MQKTLRVSHISETQKASNGRKYKVVTFIALATLNGRTILTNQKATRVMWEDFEDENKNVFKGDALYSTLQVGDEVLGDIKRVNTTEYDLGGRVCNSFTGIVFEGEDFYSVFNKQLKQNRAVCINEDGALTADIPAKPSLIVEN